MNGGQKGRALRSREAQYKAGAGPFCQLLATISLSERPIGNGTYPEKALAVRASSRAVHEIIAKETSVSEGQALEGAFCVNVRVIRRTADSVKAAPTAFVQNKAEYNEI
jgi:hypothetical protein